MIEEIPRIEGAVAHELIYAAVKLVCAARRDDADLCSGAFPVSSAVIILYDCKFTNRIDSEKLSACSSGRGVYVGRARIFDAVQKEQIFLRPVTRNRKH